MLIFAGKLRKKHLKTKKVVKKHFCYIDRNERLSWLGYSSYREYTSSPEWAFIRSQKLEQQPNCIACRRKANQVHHLNYNEKTMIGLCMTALVSLCDECHTFIEIDKHGGKRDLFSANCELFRLASLVGEKKWVNKTKKILNRDLDIAERTRPCRDCGNPTPRRLCVPCEKRAIKEQRIIDNRNKRFQPIFT